MIKSLDLDCEKNKRNIIEKVPVLWVFRSKAAPCRSNRKQSKKTRGVYCSMFLESLSHTQLESFPKSLWQNHFSSSFLPFLLCFSAFSSLLPLFLTFLPHLLKNFPKGLEIGGIRNFYSPEKVLRNSLRSKCLTLTSKKKKHLYILQTKNILVILFIGVITNKLYVLKYKLYVLFFTSLG